MDQVTFFCLQHGRVHSSKVSSVLSIADQIFSGLTDQQMRARPAKGLNSLVWLLWHMARVEDVGVNLIVMAGQQVLDEGWSSRLVPRTDVGNGKAAEELTEFAAGADIDAIRAYRDAVGRRTRDIVQALEPARWTEVVSPADAARAPETGLRSSWGSRVRSSSARRRSRTTRSILVRLSQFAAWSAPPVANSHRRVMLIRNRRPRGQMKRRTDYG